MLPNQQQIAQLLEKLTEGKISREELYHLYDLIRNTEKFRVPHTLQCWNS